MPDPTFPRRAARLVSLFTLAWLSACGGGGGGGGSDSGVRFSEPVASTSSFDVAEGGSVPDVTLTAQVSGNPGALDGKVLYVIVDDALGLFGTAATVGFDAATARATIGLAGRAQTTPGQRSGRLGVRVCLDPACANALTPAGYGVDMTLKVRTGLRTSPSPLVVQVPFGTLPDARLVAVTVPEGRDASAFSAGIVAGTDPAIVFDLERTLAPGATGVRVAPRLLPVGRYERRLEVSASSVDLGFPGSRQYVDEVPLVLEVQPSDVDFAVLPATLSFTIDHGTAALRPFTVGAVARDGSFRLDPVEHDFSAEPPGTSYPLRGGWLSTAGDAWHVAVCEGAACLPRGSYRATLRFVRLTAAGVPTGQVVEVPVELTVR